MAERSQPRPNLQGDPLPVSINWSHLRKQISGSPSSFSPAPPLQPFHSQVQVPAKKPLKPPIESNIDWRTTKGPQFVTLHQDFINDVPLDYQNVSGSSLWEVCQNQEERCLNYINQHCAEKQVILICSGSRGETFVPTILSLPNVYAIYVYCGNVPKHEQWATGYSKVRLVCNSDTEVLFPQLAFDSAYFYYQWSCALLEKGDKTKAKSKLEKASNILNNYTKCRHDKEWEARIAEQLKKCT